MSQNLLSRSDSSAARPTALIPDASAGISHVTLTVRDLDRLVSYYAGTLGLTLLENDGTTARLGAGERTLLILQQDRAARIAPAGAPGLFHNAFLLPDRAALGRWILNAAETGLRIEGASDHRVSEALYLTDPEGNGIEVYSDRPRDLWPHDETGIAMVTDPLDIDSLVRAGRAAGGARGAFPEGTVLGHVHLKVGALEPTLDFYRDTLGLELTTRYPGANFWGWNGYHHHLATNVWRSKGQQGRPEGSTGLAEISLHGLSPEGAGLSDPWGAEFRTAVA